MAWSGNVAIAVVHGDTLSLVATGDGPPTYLATVTGPVRDLDWSH